MATTDPNTLMAPTPGLINTPTVPGLAPTLTYNPNQATAATWDVKPNQTVQSQVKDIIADNSPLMQQAETRSLQKANSRGLLNSSMAVGAGQSALYDAATPIAMQDAATFAKAAEFGAGAQQQTTIANQNAGNTASQFGADASNKITQLDVQQKGDLARIAASGVVQKDLAVFSANAAKELADTEAKYKNLTQASSSAASVMNTTVQAIARMMENPDLDAGAKQRAIDIYNANASVSLSIIGALAGDVSIKTFMDEVL